VLQVLFDEFCRFVALLKMPVGGQVREAFTLSSVKMGRKERARAAGKTPTSSTYDDQPDIHTRKFAKVEEKIKVRRTTPAGVAHVAKQHTHVTPALAGHLGLGQAADGRVALPGL
jgi:hypothetical protein